MPVRDVLLVQKRELEKKLGEGFVDRDIGEKRISDSLVNVIIGPRRAGKSFFAMHLLGKTASFGYANFDDEQLVEAKNYDEIVDAIDSIYGKPLFLLFDEIQNLGKWELFVNRLQRQGRSLVITGSNSNLLSQELASHLTGRHLQIIVFPFSFKEFLGFEGKELTQSEIREKFFSYLSLGGYPEPLAKKLDYKDYLFTLFNSIIFNDIVKRFSLRNVQAIDNLASFLVSNVAKEFSLNTLCQLTKCKSVHTIEKYLKYLEEAFVFFRISRFSFKTKELAPANKKIYCIDNGFIHAKAFKLGQDSGKLCENLVAIELKKLDLSHKASVYFWKSLQQEEVDFVVKKGTKITQLIQVCFDASDKKTKDREVRALIKASKELKCKNLLVITEDLEAKQKISWFGKKATIKFTPIWKWLLQQ